MKFFLTISVLIFTSTVFSGCISSDFGNRQREEVYFDDGTVTGENNEKEVVIDDKNLLNAQAGKITQRAPEPTFENAADGSQITVTGDGYGNKTRSKCFPTNARLKCVVLETSFDGNTSITVYGKNGIIKSVPAEKLKDALNMPADEIADAAELFEPPQQADISKLLPSKNRQTELKPLPSSQFPVFPKQVSPTVIEENQSPENRQPAVEENAPRETDNQNIPDSDY